MVRASTEQLLVKVYYQSKNKDTMHTCLLSCIDTELEISLRVEIHISESLIHISDIRECLYSLKEEIGMWT